MVPSRIRSLPKVRQRCHRRALAVWSLIGAHSSSWSAIWSFPVESTEDDPAFNFFTFRFDSWLGAAIEHFATPLRPKKDQDGSGDRARISALAPDRRGVRAGELLLRKTLGSLCFHHATEDVLLLYCSGGLKNVCCELETWKMCFSGANLRRILRNIVIDEQIVKHNTRYVLPR